MQKIFNEIKKEINLFNNERNYLLVGCLNKEDKIFIYADIKQGIDLFDNVLRHFKYKYNLKITYCTINDKFTLTK